MFRINPVRNCESSVESEIFLSLFEEANSFYLNLPFYSASPLVELDKAAQHLGLKNIYVKDESNRFGLNSFKILGALFATYRAIDEAKKADRRYAGIVTATDGNHGVAVAWAAKHFDMQAIIIFPYNAVEARVTKAQELGAECIISEGNYDVAVEEANELATEKNLLLIQDTAWEGYSEIPQFIVSGYLMMFHEIEQQLASSGQNWPEVVIVQAGVGSFASAAALYIREVLGRHDIKMFCVEPTDAACLLASISAPDQKLTQIDSELDSIMAGLNCGVPSTISWEINKSYYNTFLAIYDHWAEEAVRTLNDNNIDSGESGAAGMGALLAIKNSDNYQELKEQIFGNEKASVLVINTEGTTKPCKIRKTKVSK